MLESLKNHHFVVSASCPTFEPPPLVLFMSKNVSEIIKHRKCIRSKPQSPQYLLVFASPLGHPEQDGYQDMVQQCQDILSRNLEILLVVGKLRKICLLYFIINFIAQSYSSGELKCSRCGRLGGNVAQCY